MAIITEDGTGLSSANSYVDSADVDTYAQDRGITAWTSATSAVKLAAILNAAEYLDSSYTWLGTKRVWTQSMGWPRVGVRDKDGEYVPITSVPAAVRTAQIRLAIEALSGDLLASTDGAGVIKRTRSKVDVLEKEIEYLDGSQGDRSYPLIERLLTGLYRTSSATAGGVMQISRA